MNYLPSLNNACSQPSRPHSTPGVDLSLTKSYVPPPLQAGPGHCDTVRIQADLTIRILCAGLRVNLSCKVLFVPTRQSTRTWLNLWGQNVCLCPCLLSSVCTWWVLSDDYFYCNVLLIMKSWAEQTDNPPVHCQTWSAFTRKPDPVNGRLTRITSQDVLSSLTSPRDQQSMAHHLSMRTEGAGQFYSRENLGSAGHMVLFALAGH